MQGLSVLSGVFADRVYRISMFAETITSFPKASYLNNQLRFDRLAVHRDNQGMLRTRRKSMRFLCEPATGLFTFVESRGELLGGKIQTGAFQPASFSAKLNEGDQVFGFGAATGGFTRDNQSFRLVNLDTLFFSIPESSYTSFPQFIIRRADNRFVGVFLNLSLPARVEVFNNADHPDGPGIFVTPLVAPSPAGFDFFVIDGDLPFILERFSDLSGRPFMPPLWALGFHQSRWSYRSAERVLEIAQRFRRENLPLDAIHLDIDYMDRYRVFTWHPQRFKDPAGLHRQLQELGVRTVAIVDPGVAAQEDSALYQDGLQRNMYCRRSDGSVFVGKVWPGKTTFPDFTRAEVREWWAQAHAPLFEAGVSGIWNDMNDPVLWMGKRYDPLAEDVQHSEGVHSKVRNVYANYECQSAYESFARHTRLRPFVLTRSAFSGIQRFAAVWTGDNHSSWAHLRENLNMVLNLGMSGSPLCGADVGGFAGGHPIQGTLKVFKFIKNPELVARWMELGSLMPFFRMHTALYSFDQEPWSFGGETLAISRKHMLRRYRLLPYIYNLAWQMHQTGSPMVRPVFYSYPEMRGEYADTQFLLGEDLLAAPILGPRVRRRRVALPPGVWYDYETLDRYEGGVELDFDAPLGSYPLFVRAGAILPVCEPGRNALESVASGIKLEIYPAKTMKGRLHLDDGLSAAADSEYFEQLYNGEQDRNGNLKLSLQTTRKRFVPGFNTLGLRLPAHFRSMSLRGKAIEGVERNLTSEDRAATVYEFEAPLNTTELSFDFRANWP